VRFQAGVNKNECNIIRVRNSERNINGLLERELIKVMDCEVVMNWLEISVKEDDSDVSQQVDCTDLIDLFDILVYLLCLCKFIITGSSPLPSVIQSYDSLLQLWYQCLPDCVTVMFD